MLTPAPLVEWAFQTEVSTPNDCNSLFVKLPMVFAFNGVQGTESEQKSGAPAGTWFAVIATYFFINVQGQSSGHEDIRTTVSH